MQRSWGFMQSKYLKRCFQDGIHTVPTQMPSVYKPSQSSEVQNLVLLHGLRHLISASAETQGQRDPGHCQNPVPLAGCAPPSFHTGMMLSSPSHPHLLSVPAKVLLLPSVFWKQIIISLMRLDFHKSQDCWPCAVCTTHQFNTNYQLGAGEDGSPQLQRQEV